MTDRELQRRASHRWPATSARRALRRDRAAGLLQWLRRHEAGGVAALRDGSSRPHTSPNATQVEVVWARSSTCA